MAATAEEHADLAIAGIGETPDLSPLLAPTPMALPAEDMADTPAVIALSMELTPDVTARVADLMPLVTAEVTADMPDRTADAIPDIAAEASPVMAAKEAEVLTAADARADSAPLAEDAAPDTPENPEAMTSAADPADVDAAVSWVSPAVNTDSPATAPTSPAMAATAEAENRVIALAAVVTWGAHAPTCCSCVVMLLKFCIAAMAPSADA